jgi:hypothetical protein
MYYLSRTPSTARKVDMASFMRRCGVLLLLVLVGCSARTSAPPGAGYERGGIPELRGERVIVLPVQMRTAGHPDLDSELEFALREFGGSAEWVLPVTLRTALERSPGTGIRIDGLPVRVFLAGEVQRVGDPLFGDLYRLGALVDAPWALLPVEASVGSGTNEEGGHSVMLSAALLDVRTGRVVWFGVVEGVPDAPGGLAGTASVAEALARRLSS